VQHACRVHVHQRQADLRSSNNMVQRSSKQEQVVSFFHSPAVFSRMVLQPATNRLSTQCLHSAVLISTEHSWQHSQAHYQAPNTSSRHQTVSRYESCPLP
jgi:hypothetical protein